MLLLVLSLTLLKPEVECFLDSIMFSDHLLPQNCVMFDLRGHIIYHLCFICFLLGKFDDVILGAQLLLHY